VLTSMTRSPGPVGDVRDAAKNGHADGRAGVSMRPTSVGARGCSRRARSILRDRRDERHPEPAEEGSLGFPDHAAMSQVSGDYARRVGRSRRSRRIERARREHPSAPTEVGLIETPGAAIGVAVFGSIAYVADWTGLRSSM